MKRFEQNMAGAPDKEVWKGEQKCTAVVRLPLRALPRCQLPETQHMLQNIGTINEPLPSPKKIEPIVTKAYFVWFLLITGLRLHHLPFFSRNVFFATLRHMEGLLSTLLNSQLRTAATAQVPKLQLQHKFADCSYGASPQASPATK